MNLFHICENDEGKECGKYQQQSDHAPECYLRHGYTVLVATDILDCHVVFPADPRYGIVDNAIDFIQQCLSVVFRKPYRK